MKATVITDASFCPDTKAAGWAVWIAYDGGKIKKYGRFKRDPAHSGQAELWALLNGIAIATRAGAKLILAQSDCQSALDLVKENPDKVWQALGLVGLKDRPKINTKHVEGHTKHAGARYWVNRWCDTGAGSIMREIRSERAK